MGSTFPFVCKPFSVYFLLKCLKCFAHFMELSFYYWFMGVFNVYGIQSHNRYLPYGCFPAHLWLVSLVGSFGKWECFDEVQFILCFLIWSVHCVPLLIHLLAPAKIAKIFSNVFFQKFYNSVLPFRSTSLLK